MLTLWCRWCEKKYKNERCFWPLSTRFISWKTEFFSSILSRAHKYYSKPFVYDHEKVAAASDCKKFTQLFPIYFPKANITRKMHIFSFVLPHLILADKTKNMCYLFLKVEQAGERLHQIWNSLTRAKYFSVKNSKQRLRYTFLDYEIMLYVSK